VEQNYTDRRKKEKKKEDHDVLAQRYAFHEAAIWLCQHLPGCGKSQNSSLQVQGGLKHQTGAVHFSQQPELCRKTAGPYR
jgi:hypothetical protein